MERRKGNILLLPLLMFLAVTMGISLYFFWPKQPFLKNNISTTPQNSKSFGTIISNISPKSPVIIYGEAVNSSTASGQWRTDWEISALIDDSSPEKLFVLKNTTAPTIRPTKDHKFLLINSNNQLIRFEFATGKLTPLLTTKSDLSDYAVSPDDKELFILERNWDNTKEQASYLAKTVTIETGENKFLSQGTLEKSGGALYPALWRTDNIVIINEGLGEGSRTWTYDLNSNSLKKTGLAGIRNGTYGNTGKFSVEVGSWTGNPCNALMGSSPEFYQLIDPVSETKGIKFGTKGEITDITAFSPDDSEILFSSSSAPQTTNNPQNPFEGCNIPTTHTSYVVNTKTGLITSIDSSDELLKDWGANSVGAAVDNQIGYPDGNYSQIVNSTIKIGNKSRVSSKNELQIFSQYFQ